MEKISISEFKATCLAKLQDVARTGKPLLVTKRGKPIAQIVPAPAILTELESGFGSMAGTVEEIEDIVQPLPAEAWGRLG